MTLVSPIDSAGFPVVLKAGEGDFSALPTPRRLLVPCPGVALDAPLDLKKVDVLLKPGEPLTLTPHASAPVPLAPTIGRISRDARVHLTDGREARAIAFDDELSDDPWAAGSADEAPPLAREFLVDLPSPNQILEAIRELGSTDLSYWIDRLRDSGVWADRWASPDLLGQLNQAMRRPVDTIICNTLDATAAMPLQRELAGAFPHELIAGAAVLGKLTGARFVWIVLDEADAPAIAQFMKPSAVMAGVNLVTVRNIYPQPQPTLLLHTLTRRKLRPGELPTAHGAMMLDAAAAIAIGKVVLRNEPAVAAPVAIFDATLGRAYLRWCPIGTSVRDALALLDIIPKGARLPTVYAGVPMRRVTVPDDSVISAGSELTLHVSTDPPATMRADPCIRCGWCVEGCPVRIHPAGLLDAAQLEDRALAERNGLDACIECGICSYVCPSRLPLLEGIRFLRKSVMP